MKAIIEFDLDNPDEKRAHLRCVKSTDMACVLYDITRNLKHTLQIRYGDDRKELDEVFKEIQGYMEEFSINIEELIN